MTTRIDRVDYSSPPKAAEREAGDPETRADEALRLDDIEKRFGAHRAAAGVNLKVRRGEFLTLLGPSGCGKTTLLNLIAGFLEPDGGEIFIDDEWVTETPPHRRNIGVVFQNYALFPHMNIRDNVAFGLRMRGIGRGERHRRADEALAMVQLAEFGDRQPRELSGGQQQRVALARALVIEPHVLLLDEPLSALDKNLRTEMQVELKQIQQKVGITTVFVTHDQTEALSLSDRIAVMSDGVIRQLATPEDIYCRPHDSFVASFIGDINRLPARVAALDGTIAAVDMDCGVRVTVPCASNEALQPGTRAEVYVRPDQLWVMDPRATDDSAALTGTVVTQVYQGTHVDLHVRLNDGTPVVARVPPEANVASQSTNEPVRLGWRVDDAHIFPTTEESTQ
ncbi:MAG: ABC transporter ATP-binding protein [Spiribacter salinus]|uniref:Spermidine/putrescine import ATP-binding protein PotA n=1 Tax=Spiribacter salinus TaxID=1335746 RepID=A0A540VRE3_9GAMM|nr:MAG: ABC transporter ATP-binding protein [Spiribacter salinus]